MMLHRRGIGVDVGGVAEYHEVPGAQVTGCRSSHTRLEQGEHLGFLHGALLKLTNTGACEDVVHHYCTVVRKIVVRKAVPGKGSLSCQCRKDNCT